MQLAARILLVWMGCLGALGAQAGGLLDGLVFEGTIGPAEAPDLEDRLHFSDGHFWSDICTRCGFVPGTYQSERTAAGIEFHGILESDSRGQFRYSGVVDQSGGIEVDIRWERKRWYWTASRDIMFIGRMAAGREAAELPEILRRMGAFDPESNPACARF